MMTKRTGTVGRLWPRYVPAVRLRVTIDIAASPERIWAEIESIESHVEWMKDAERIVFTSRSTRGVGTEFDCHTRLGPFRTVDHMRVTGWEPRRRMDIVHEGAVTGRGSFLLRPKRNGATKFVWVERQLTFPKKFAGPVGAFVARPLLKRVWRGNLRRLAKLCEV